MARPRKSDKPDTAQAHDLTAGLIERLSCPEGKQQAFLRDSKANGLRVRVTANGAKSYVFESKLNRQTIRRTIGDATAWSIEQARAEANRLRVLLDSGHDPRELDRQQAEQKAAMEAAEAADKARHTLTGLQAWAEYAKEGQQFGFTKRGPWSKRHHQDHIDFASPGGIPRKRGKGTTAPGILHGLLDRPLAGIDDAAITDWLQQENASRPTRAALGFRLLRGFLNWCGTHKQYRTIACADAHRPKEVRREVRGGGARADALQREHLRAWFAAVLEHHNKSAAAVLIALLLTGARKNEITSLRKEDVSYSFGGSLRLHDKVEAERIVPLPRYLAQVLQSLPKHDGLLMFGGDTAEQIGRQAAYVHKKALIAAGLPHVSLHGLRRSFGNLAEWSEVPSGVVPQIQGHKPSATAEKHYRVRPLDLLRLHHNRIVDWMLSEAGIQYDAEAEPGKLQLVVNS